MPFAETAALCCKPCSEMANCIFAKAKKGSDVGCECQGDTAHGRQSPDAAIDMRRSTAQLVASAGSPGGRGKRAAEIGQALPSNGGVADDKAAALGPVDEYGPFGQGYLYVPGQCRIEALGLMRLSTGGLAPREDLHHLVVRNLWIALFPAT